MSKPSHLEKILTEGMRFVHARGFANSGVRDIVQAAGVPQGSFTNHFASKEAFGVAVIDRYFEATQKVLGETLLNDSIPPLQRVRLWVDANRATSEQSEMRNGCLFGNFAAEASEHSEAMRSRLVLVFAEIQRCLAYCLRAAVKAGELPADFECDEIA